MVQQSEGTLDARGHLNVEFPVPQPTTMTPTTTAIVWKPRSPIPRVAPLTRGELRCYSRTIVANADPDRYVYHKGEVAKVGVSTSDYEGKTGRRKSATAIRERTWTKKEKKEDTNTETEGYSYPEYEMHERLIASGEVQTDSQGRASYDYTTTKTATFRSKTVINEGGKQVASIGGYLWVTDQQSEWSDSSYYSEDYNSIKLVPDKNHISREKRPMCWPSCQRQSSSAGFRPK